MMGHLSKLIDFSLCHSVLILLLQSGLSLEERVALIRSVGEEIIQDDELFKLLKAKPHPNCYDGFEPSGRMHIAQVRESPY